MSVSFILDIGLEFQKQQGLKYDSGSLNPFQVQLVVQFKTTVLCIKETQPFLEIMNENIKRDRFFYNI
ncbi:hypothetical protein B0A67_18950 [Flavobacterium aquidurense]|nr:hypothetical protein B0A67_18950 [Flavobacterium aquidurense]